MNHFGEVETGGIMHTDCKGVIEQPPCRGWIDHAADA
jgi:hypothetical protein